MIDRERSEVLRILTADPSRSDRSIAAEVGVGDRSVNRLRREAEQNGTGPCGDHAADVRRPHAARQHL